MTTHYEDRCEIVSRKLKVTMSDVIAAGMDAGWARAIGIDIADETDIYAALDTVSIARLAEGYARLTICMAMGRQLQICGSGI